jgi:hypothetical protein
VALPGLFERSLDVSAFGKSRRFQARAKEGKIDPNQTSTRRQGQLRLLARLERLHSARIRMSRFAIGSVILYRANDDILDRSNQTFFGNLVDAHPTDFLA